jgi:exopolysaccharide production protein ExoZ
MRLNSLDYLRGLAAIGIVIYHFNSWHFGTYDSTSVISRFGLYGVSIFYMLSGLTLFHIYEKKMFVTENVTSFFVKRFFRIMPLLWLATTLTIIGAKVHFSAWRIFLSYSGLFSFLAPKSYIAGGAWSIGNEICFYVVFPLIIFLFQKKRPLFYILLTLFLLCHIYYAFFILSSQSTVANQWALYISPLNQAVFFAAGILIYLFNKYKQLSLRYAILLFVAGVLLFAFFPIFGPRSNLIVGTDNLLFLLFCCVIVYSSLNINATSILPVHSVLKWLGEISYSVYLLHPLIWKLTTILTNRFFKNISFTGSFLIGLTVTLLISHLVYNYFEIKISKFGRKFS